MIDIWQRILDKCLSARFLVLIMVAITYCLVINSCLYLVTVDKMDVEFLKGLVAGLASNLVLLWKDYSARQDRYTKDNGEEREDVKNTA